MDNLCCCFGFGTKPEDSDNTDEAWFRQNQVNTSSAASSPNEEVQTRQPHCAIMSSGHNLNSSINQSSGKLNKKVVQNIDSSETEDVCPTCLEEYSTDNPKITLQCSHIFHLSCIIEWQQRRDNCPICDRVMEFDEMN